MQSLAIKYRPRTFEDTVEQGLIKKILQEQLKTRTFQHNYLFCGGAGTGKTTISRIFANEINEGKGSILELDGASNNGIDDIREITEQAKMKAIESEYRIFIIDECHMLSNSAWAGLLKLIEEPPAKSIFIFCTTDPQKIPSTIISRVQRYDFQKITFNSIVSRLEHVLEQERIENKDLKYEINALEYIAKIADGGMRDALTLLDKCISYSTDLNIRSVVDSLGIVDYEVMFKLLNKILLKEESEVIILIEEMYNRGIDLKQFIKNFNSFILDVSKYRLLRNFEHIQTPVFYKAELEKVCATDGIKIRELLHKTISIYNDIKYESNPKATVEVELMLLC